MIYKKKIQRNTTIIILKDAMKKYGINKFFVILHHNKKNDKNTLNDTKTHKSEI